MKQYMSKFFKSTKDSTVLLFLIEWLAFVYKDWMGTGEKPATKKNSRTFIQED